MPFFSIIIPLYNKDKFIQNTLKSVLSQSFSDFEIIIVNDGSTDSSEEKVLNFEDPRIEYFYKENEGVSKARNFGIEKATSNYICFLDADDYWYSTFLTEFHKTIKNYPEQKIFSCAIEIQTSKTKYPAIYSIDIEKSEQLVNYFEASLKQSIICTSGIIIHKSVFEKTEGFNQKLKTGEDTDLWIRIGLHYPILFINKILVCYIFDEKGLSRQQKNFERSLNYSDFSELEKSDPKLKTFLDYNRFSDAIKAKIYGNKKHFYLMYSQINEKNLPLKKRILLKFPSFILKTLIKLQKVFNSKSFFK
ncbi:glycosyltransferase family 2 protein [Flavobacterium terrae]|uniref:Glycosyl transferase family 2 n=1 Tax=Flavobacterium terrae TaxID=415425 RepID=A0A1M6CNK3_9FLAO|nr:glycosyltransferase family 2 protein [Flavobacterium terrae]SHI62374.1 Glycosyl transferase family 2 [Flavobacterium terrae]